VRSLVVRRGRAGVKLRELVIMISYEDPQSLTAKVNYAVSNGLGGVMIWELGSDDSEGTLVNAVAAALS
jgi:chitinase